MNNDKDDCYETNLLLKFKTLSASKTINDYIKNLPLEHEFLKNYQYVIYQYFMSKHFQNKQLLLLWLSVGRGKTLLSLACAISGIQSKMFERVIILSPKSIQDEFIKNLHLYFKMLTDYNVVETNRLYNKYISYFNFIAYNSWKAYESFKQLKNIERSLFIIDEAHLFMKSIIKVQLDETNMNDKNTKYIGNAKRIYDAIQSVKNKKILALTGTPSAKTPFECIPLFNLAYNKPLFTEDIREFTLKYIDVKRNIIKNVDELRRKINGLVAYVPSTAEIALKTKRYDENVPKASELKIVYVEMSKKQYIQYLIDYKKELEENSFSTKKNIYGWSYGSFSTFHTKSFEDCIYYNDSLTNKDNEDRNKGKIKIDATHCPKLIQMYEDSTKINGCCVFYFRFTAMYGIATMKELLKSHGYTAITDHKSGGNACVLSERENEHTCNECDRNNTDNTYCSNDIYDLNACNDNDYIECNEHTSNDVIDGGNALLINNIFTTKAKRYVIFSGDESDRLRNLYKSMFNDKRNRYGEYIKYLLLSPSGSVGITLKNVRFLGVGSVEFNNSAIVQILGRVNRLNSHNDLPVKDRTIENRIYIMTKNKAYYKAHKKEIDKLCNRTSDGITESAPTIENIIYHDAIKDDIINDEFRNKVLIPASITEVLYKKF